MSEPKTLKKVIGRFAGKEQAYKKAEEDHPIEVHDDGSGTGAEQAKKLAPYDRKKNRMGVNSDEKVEGVSESAPPGREDQVKALKKKFPKQAAYKIAWSQYRKKQAVKEEQQLDELTGKGKLGAIATHHFNQSIETGKEWPPKPADRERSKKHSEQYSRAQNLKSLAAWPAAQRDAVRKGKVGGTRPLAGADAEVQKRKKKLAEGLENDPRISKRFRAIMKHTDNYLKKRHMDIITRARAGHSVEQIASDLKIHPGIVDASIRAEPRVKK